MYLKDLTCLFQIWLLLPGSRGQRSAHKVLGTLPLDATHVHQFTQDHQKAIPTPPPPPLCWDRCESTPATLNPKNSNLARLHGVCSLLSLQTSSVDVFTVLSRYDGHCLLLPAIWNNWQLLSDNWRGLSSGASLSFIVGVRVQLLVVFMLPDS